MIAAFLALAVLSQQPPTPNTRVTIVAEQTALAAGEENLLGLKFELDHGWHIFWQNPGDAGAPPKVDWTLPAGYTAGSLIYPAPSRIQSESYTIYGYEGTVLLLSPIRVPKQTSAGAELTANIRYILCREVCIPAHASPSIALPVGSGGPSAAKAAFDKARAHVPQPAPAAWSARAEIGKDDVAVTVITGQRDTRLEFFPLEPGIVNDVIAPEQQTIDRGVKILMKRSEQLLNPPKQLTFVVKLPDGRAYKMTAPVTAAQ